MQITVLTCHWCLLKSFDNAFVTSDSRAIVFALKFMLRGMKTKGLENISDGKTKRSAILLLTAKWALVKPILNELTINSLFFLYTLTLYFLCVIGERRSSNLRYCWYVFYPQAWVHWFMNKHLSDTVLGFDLCNRPDLDSYIKISANPMPWCKAPFPLALHSQWNTS